MESEITIIGGGIIGLSIACILAQLGVSVILIEKHKYSSNVKDGRSSALTFRSKLLYEKYDIWSYIEKYANPIESIKIIDSKFSSIVNFSKNIVDGKTLGYMIDNHILITNLYDIANSYDNLTIINNDYKSIYSDLYDARVDVGYDIINSDLIIAADGKNSPIRKFRNIKYTNHDFDQIAIICNVLHEKCHDNIACEKFFTTGPFAILPLTSGYSSSIVWVEETAVAKLYLKMNDHDFLYYLSRKFGDFLGNIKITSKIFSYNLSSTHIDKYFDNRIAFIGDAAHSIHPIAGQGLNLGLIDVEILSELINSGKSIGTDIGSESLLNEYNNLRKGDNLNMLNITSGLNYIFSNDNFYVEIARKLGLSLIESLNPIKRFFMEYAMGKR